MHETENCHFLTAEDDDSNVYLAFRGSVTTEDWKTNFNINLARLSPEENLAGRVHSGFLEKAKEIPLLTILSSKDLKGKQFIICGHSQGGAVAAIVYTLLKEAKSSSETSFLEGIRGLKNITFAAPLFGDEELKSIIEDEKFRFDSDMFHYVAQNDPVPGSLLFSSRVPEIQKYARDSWWRFMIRPSIYFLGLTFKPLGNFLRKHRDCLNASTSELRKLYQPIGNYIFLGTDGSLNFVDCDNKSQKVNMLEKMSKLEPNWKDHKLDNYKHLLSDILLNAERLTNKTTIFKPKISNVEIISQKSSQSQYKIEITGENLDSDSLRMCKLIIGNENQTVFNHNCPENSKIDICQRRVSLEAKLGKHFHDSSRKIVWVKTIFGETEFDLANSGTEKSVSACLQMAFERYSAFEAKMIGNELTKAVREILICSEVEQNYVDYENQNLGRFVDQVVQTFKSPLILTAKYPSKNFLEGAISSVGLLSFDWHCCAPNEGTLTVGREIDTDAHLNGNYSIVLRYLSSRIEQYCGKQLPCLQKTTANRTDLELEEAICQKFVQKTETEIFHLICSNVDWYCVESSAKQMLLRAIMRIIKLNSIRKCLEKDLFIGIVGQQNAGKTHFVNKLCKKSEPVGLLTHTTEIKFYFVKPNVYIVDFPGFDATKEYRKYFTDFGSMIDFFVFISKYEGDPDDKTCQAIHKIAEKSHQSGLSKNILICFNQSMAVMAQIQEELKTRNQTFAVHKKDLLEEINDEQFNFEESDAFFTDWDLENGDEGNEFGIVGMDTIRDELKKRLNLGNVDFRDSSSI